MLVSSLGQAVLLLHLVLYLVGEELLKELGVPVLSDAWRLALAMRAGGGDDLAPYLMHQLLQELLPNSRVSDTI
jgi:hypothetical protein